MLPSNPKSSPFVSEACLNPTCNAPSSSSSSSSSSFSKERFADNSCAGRENPIADDKSMSNSIQFDQKHQHRQITWEKLSKYFGLTVKEAASRLNIHPTQLLRCCRSLGIEKWPYEGIKEVTAIRKQEQLSAVHPIEEMKFGNTVVQETIEFGLRNTARRVPIGVNLAEFKGTNYHQKIMIPPITPMVIFISSIYLLFS